MIRQPDQSSRLTLSSIGHRSSKFDKNRTRLTRLLGLALLCLTAMIAAPSAHAATRSLTLYNTHTKETATITYKRNGKFDADGLRKMNRFLRDWRRNESTSMDPALFDLMWEVYKLTGAKKPIHVVSGYRSPATNSMLRSRSSGVAKNSRHTMGQAMDFYLPGVSISKIRDVGLRLQAGGVGYYPGSRSPFVHIDTGNVRHWPRMSRKQLAKVFPKGNTVHVPSDGKPFSGYQQAKAVVAKRKADMVRTSRSVRRFTQVASAAPKPAAKTATQVAERSQSEPSGSGTLLTRLLNRTPQSPPAPTFTAATTPAPVSLFEDNVDELEETAQEPGGAGPAADGPSDMPMQLAALPRSPENRPQSGSIQSESPAQQETQSPDATLSSTVASATQTQFVPVIDAANAVPVSPVSNDPDGTQIDNSATLQEPVQLAAMPRARPASLQMAPVPAGADLQLASALPVGDSAQDQDQAQDQAQVQSQGQIAEDGSLTESREGTATDATPTAQQGREPILVASLPKARLASPGQPDEAQPASSLTASTQEADGAADQTDGNAAEILARMTGQAPSSPSSQATNRVAYAATSTDFIAALPTARQRSERSNEAGSLLASLPKTASRDQLAANPTARQAEPEQAANRLPTTVSEADRLARLTFAYGPSGMAHFAHMKQPAKTATFARLSRPLPNNLNALVSKPDSMIDQTFSHSPSQLVQDAHFVGAAIARMAVRSFN